MSFTISTRIANMTFVPSGELRVICRGLLATGAADFSVTNSVGETITVKLTDDLIALLCMLSTDTGQSDEQAAEQVDEPVIAGELAFTAMNMDGTPRVELSGFTNDTPVSTVAAAYETATGVTPQQIFVNGRESGAPLKWCDTNTRTELTLRDNNINPASDYELAFITADAGMSMRTVKEIIHGYYFSPQCNDCGGQAFYHGDCVFCIAKARGTEPEQECIHGDGIVNLVDGSSTRVDNLEAGYIVQTAAGFTEIGEVIKCTSIRRKMSVINGAKVTSDHPMRVDGKWVLPQEYDPSGVKEYNCAVYNFVMKDLPENKNSHTIIVNGAICATLGHGPKNLAVRFPDADRKYGEGFWNTYVPR